MTAHPGRRSRPPELELAIEKPVAGGRMLARHQGKVVLVVGAIPGERVRVAVERSARDVAFASVTEVIEASPDRRPLSGDPACGGHVYAHVRYERQCRLKSDVVADALRRIAGVAWDQPVRVAQSPEHGYRMRARLHVRGRRAGFLREGTHQLCDPAATGQLLPRTVQRIARLREALAAVPPGLVEAFALAEDISGDQAAVHVVTAADSSATALASFADVDDVTGISATSAEPSRVILLAGLPEVADPVDRLLPSAVGFGELRRRPSVFFQGNRYLLPDLVQRVVASACRTPVVDLFAGVGLFALTLAAAGRDRVTAVEADPAAAEDLARNVAGLGPVVTVVATSVEAFLAAYAGAAVGTVIVDPPRTGLSADALGGVVALAAPRLVYVSCDVATFARDLRRLTAAGYALQRLDGFDLFPNTAHVELVAVLDRSA